MSHFLRPIFGAAFAAALLMAGLYASSDADAASAYDGNWSVVINTLRGDCDRSLRYSVRIVNNQVLATEQNYRVAGRVSPGGEIRVVVAEAGRSASGFGRLVGNNGRGQWRTSTGQCAGSWTAVRRANNW
ncbi:MAG: hypothetical protein KGK33_06100 [Hyphomicrobiales bacterium]|nr:hypothetical protein [Hyphomicrobiales bacterium]MDE2284169.1 hypothetical protein [Hyphomicrobiales bacterium]MDE2374708.1 hypothetical protein [Hyphomicrobiales bacterium]